MNELKIFKNELIKIKNDLNENNDTDKTNNALFLLKDIFKDSKNNLIKQELDEATEQSITKDQAYYIAYNRTERYSSEQNYIISFLDNSHYKYYLLNDTCDPFETGIFISSVEGLNAVIDNCLDLVEEV